MLKLLFLLFFGIMHAHEEKTAVTNIIKTLNSSIDSMQGMFSIDNGNSMFLIPTDFYSETVGMRKKTLNAVIHSMNDLLEQVYLDIAPMVGPLGKAITPSQQLIATRYNQFSLECLENIAEMIYYNAVMLYALFSISTKPFILENAWLLEHLRIDKPYVSHGQNEWNESIQHEMLTILKNFNENFNLKRNVSSRSDFDRKTDNNLLLNASLRSHLGAFNKYLLTQFPINKPALQSDIQALKNKLDTFINLFIPFAIDIQPKFTIDTGLLTVFNNDLIVLQTLQENA